MAKFRRLSKRQRQTLYQDLVIRINYEQPPLLPTRIREDPLRVVYPASVDFPCFRKINDEELIRIRKFRKESSGVPQWGTGKPRGLCMPAQYCVGGGGCLSTNPYVTFSGSDGPLVVIWILLKVYPEGSLRQALSENPVTDYAWKKWPRSNWNRAESLS
ncbi:hypothetical protein ACJ72_05578 [Emergomyces africanus]|uniref:Uncharacterized protein n=1 Tax=Emergomyces africanus TaxID=1955775 RepID=A0A1B7NTK3_9EURO|nr:hypothetical protein ACJ72_05578 [Emergomyces africanus]